MSKTPLMLANRDFVRRALNRPSKRISHRPIFGERFAAWLVHNKSVDSKLFVNSLSQKFATKDYYHNTYQVAIQRNHVIRFCPWWLQKGFGFSKDIMHFMTQYATSLRLSGLGTRTQKLMVVIHQASTKTLKCLNFRVDGTNSLAVALIMLCFLPLRTDIHHFGSMSKWRMLCRHSKLFYCLFTLLVGLNVCQYQGLVQIRHWTNQGLNLPPIDQIIWQTQVLGSCYRSNKPNANV